MNGIPHVELDGTEFAAAHGQIADRLQSILSFANDCRRHGKGIFALPETSRGLREIATIVGDIENNTEVPVVDEPENSLDWPKCSASRKKKLKKLVAECAGSLAHDARRILKLVGPCIGEFPANTNWSMEPSPQSPLMRYSPRAYFLNAIYRGGGPALKVLPILERLFGGSADDFLSQLLVFSRFESELIRLSGTTAYFDSVFTALIVGDDTHLSQWAEQFEGQGLPTAVRRACEILQGYIRDRGDSSKTTKCTSKSTFDVAMHQAFLGLAQRSRDLVDEGVNGLFNAWPRTDLAVWEGRRVPFINVPAIAVLRAAIRADIAPTITDEEGSDRELIEAREPIVARSPFVVYPGINLVVNESGLEPATLFLNRRCIP